MDITEQCVVALTWTLKDTLGEVLDVLDEPVEFLVGGDDLLPRIEEALQGHAPGARVDLHLEPEEAFGDFNDQLLFLEPRKLFPPELEEGMTFEGSALPKPARTPRRRRTRSTPSPRSIPEHVVLDGNHPLAGIAIRLSLKVEAVREATEEEIGRGTCGTGFFRIEVTPTERPQRPSCTEFHKKKPIPSPLVTRRSLNRKHLAHPKRFRPCRSSRSRPRRARWARQIRSPG
jgi:FKBP-type peptidyl-prolyl cis-trans isomerase SlyD